MNISKGDINFIKNKLLPWTGLRAVYIAWENSKRKWPDIKIELGEIPIITITPEWRRQNKQERHKRLVHEGLHVLGMEHDESIGFSTIPARDSYSKKVYRSLI